MARRKDRVFRFYDFMGLGKLSAASLGLTVWNDGNQELMCTLRAVPVSYIFASWT